jgi:hypothetical protein
MRFSPKPTPINVIHHCIEHYLMGRVEWASLYVGIIEALVEQNDRLFDQSLSLLSRLPPKLGSLE